MHWEEHLGLDHRSCPEAASSRQGRLAGRDREVDPQGSLSEPEVVGSWKVGLAEGRLTQVLGLVRVQEQAPMVSQQELEVVLVDSCWEDKEHLEEAAWELLHTELEAVQTGEALAEMVLLLVEGIHLEASVLQEVQNHRVASGHLEAEIRLVVPDHQEVRSHLEACCQYHLEDGRLQLVRSHQEAEAVLDYIPCLDHRLKGDT